MSTLQFAKQLRRNQTNTENMLWYYLRNRHLGGYKSKRQWPIGPYIIDFVCLTKKLIIELDGSQHLENKNRKYDNKRTNFLEEHRYIVVRILDNELYENKTSVLEKILKYLETSP